MNDTFTIRLSGPDLKLYQYRHPYGEDRLDLCDECQKKLELFVESGGKI